MLQKLIEISHKLEFADLEKRLLTIESTLNNGQAELIVPLVGEFSAGKTTLVNALTDSKALECASKPTTASIYAIHFGASHSHAVVHNVDGTSREVVDIAQLKNDQLADCPVIDVYDTSRKVPESIVIVDTPGLSSQDIKHRQTLVDFLPQADAVILVSDINQQMTKGLTDFATTLALSKRPLYLTFTQCDTKSQADVTAAKEYLLKNTELPLNGVVCVSAKTDAIDELCSLLLDIQRDKTTILTRVNEERCKMIAQEMVARIDILLDSSKSDTSINDAIREQEVKLNRIKRQINSLLDTISSDLAEIQRSVSRQFEDKIFERLDSIVAGKSSDYDSEAISTINNTSSLLLNEFKSQVIDLLGNKVRETKGTVSLEGLQSIDLSQLAITGLSYNINLNVAGHEYDGALATGLKIAAVAGAVVATAGAASPAVAGGAGIGGAGLTGGQAVMVGADILDTVTDVGSMISNKRTVDRINQAVKFGNKFNQNLGAFNDFNAQVGQHMGQSKGLVESLVGFVTDKAMGKPQRRRVIHQYIDTSLAPTFAAELRRITTELRSSISATLNNAAEVDCLELTASLQALQRDSQEQIAAFEQRIKELKECKQLIKSL